MFPINGKHIALGLILMAAAPLAVAQSGQDFDDQTLASYAEARSEIRDISQSYQQEMEQAEDREAAQELQQEMRDEMVEAVEASGISVQEYNTITQEASKDRELRQRITDAE